MDSTALPPSARQLESAHFVAIENTTEAETGHIKYRSVDTKPECQVKAVKEKRQEKETERGREEGMKE